jgi:plasmid stabilization system protein ParE
MTIRVRISARAANQVRKAAEWWAANRLAAPDAIAEDFAEAIALLTKHPEIGALYVGARTPGVRRLFLRRVRYFVYYKFENRELRVLAFWHASRGHQPSL